MPPTSSKPSATVTPKRQVTLPRELRNRVGLQKGSEIRFNISDRNPVTVERVLFDLEDLWKLADQDNTPQLPMKFDEMNAAKSRTEW